MVIEVLNIIDYNLLFSNIAIQHLDIIENKGK